MLDITVINSFLQKLSTWVTATSNTSTKINFLLLTSVTFLRALRCVAHSTLIVSLTIALLFSLEMCIVQIQSVRVSFACTKRLFNLSAEAIINARIARLCARCAIIPLRIFLCRLVKGFTLLKRVQSQFKMVLEMSTVLASFVSTERNANL